MPRILNFVFEINYVTLMFVSFNLCFTGNKSAPCYCEYSRSTYKSKAENLAPFYVLLSRRPEVFWKKGVLRNFEEIHRKTLEFLF